MENFFPLKFRVGRPVRPSESSVAHLPLFGNSKEVFRLHAPPRRGLWNVGRHCGAKIPREAIWVVLRACGPASTAPAAIQVEKVVLDYPVQEPEGP